MTDTPKLSSVVPSLANLRDIGGPESSFGGTVRTGSVFRSTDLASLSADGAQTLADLGIVHDLRSAHRIRTRDGTGSDAGRYPRNRPGRIGGQAVSRHSGSDAADDRRPGVCCRSVGQRPGARVLSGKLPRFRDLAECGRVVPATVRRLGAAAQLAGTHSLHHGQGSHGLGSGRVTAVPGCLRGRGLRGLPRNQQDFVADVSRRSSSDSRPRGSTRPCSRVSSVSGASTWRRRWQSSRRYTDPSRPTSPTA